MSLPCDLCGAPTLVTRIDVAIDEPLLVACDACLLPEACRLCGTLIPAGSGGHCGCRPPVRPCPYCPDGCGYCDWSGVVCAHCLPWCSPHGACGGPGCRWEVRDGFGRCIH